NEGTIAVLSRLAVALGKTPVIVQDSPGFVVNRILMPYLNEAATLVGEGLTVKEVDDVMTRFGMVMGPLAVLDQVGLVVAAHVSQVMQPVVGDRSPPNSGFELMRQKGWLGQKSGVGFYDHRGKRTRGNDLAQNALVAVHADPSAALSQSLPFPV